jgi:hypothetical protein
VEGVGVVVEQEEVGKGAGGWGDGGGSHSGVEVEVEVEEEGARHAADARRQEACWASSCNRAAATELQQMDASSRLATESPGCSWRSSSSSVC